MSASPSFADVFARVPVRGRCRNDSYTHSYRQTYTWRVAADRQEPVANYIVLLKPTEPRRGVKNMSSPRMRKPRQPMVDLANRVRESACPLRNFAYSAVQKETLSVKEKRLL